MREKLWTYLHEEHGLSLLESELNDIETIVYADLRKLVEDLKDDARKAMINGDPGASGVIHSIKKIENLLNGG